MHLDDKLHFPKRTFTEREKLKAEVKSLRLQLDIARMEPGQMREVSTIIEKLERTKKELERLIVHNVNCRSSEV